MPRLTIFAKGNLDVHDALHSLRVADELQWNGINEVVRARHPGTTMRVRHETWTRSDALLAADGKVPAAFDGHALDLGPHPLASQFSNALFTTPADAFVLSVQPDVAFTLAQHRRDAFLLYPEHWQSWPEAERRWLRDEFVPSGLLDVATSMRNLETIVTRLQQTSSAPVLVYNLCATIPGDSVHCYLGLDETLSTRVRKFNLGVVELSQRTGISVIDVDAIVARAGLARCKIDSYHFTAEGARLVAEETVRVLEDLGLFSATA